MASGAAEAFGADQVEPDVRWKERRLGEGDVEVGWHVDRDSAPRGRSSRRPAKRLLGETVAVEASKPNRLDTRSASERVSTRSAARRPGRRPEEDGLGGGLGAHDVRHDGLARRHGVLASMVPSTGLLRASAKSVERSMAEGLGRPVRSRPALGQEVGAATHRGVRFPIGMRRRRLTLHWAWEGGHGLVRASKSPQERLPDRATRGRRRSCGPERGAVISRAVSGAGGQVREYANLRGAAQPVR